MITRTEEDKAEKRNWSEGVGRPAQRINRAIRPRFVPETVSSLPPLPVEVSSGSTLVFFRNRGGAC